MKIRIGVAILAAGAMALAGGAALASGGGGGGMNEAPSASGPAYDPVAEYQKGMAALRANDFKGAEKAFSHVLSQAPKDANTLFLMGVAKAGKGDQKGAQTFYTRSTEADPTLLAAHRELALTDVRLGEPGKAATERDALQKLSDTCAGTCADTADLKAALAAVDAAMTPAATPAAPAGPVPPTSMLFTPGDGDHAYVQAVSLINQGRYGEAIDSLHAAQAAFGPHPDVLTYLGYASRKMGRTADAEGYYRQALAIAPQHRGATEYYGELKVAEGDMAGARKLLARLDDLCTYGCAEAEDLRRWVDKGGQP